VQDAAHSGLLRNARQQLHRQIAESLEAHSPELMDTQPELFAQHYAEAGLVEKSVAYWGKAGRRSAARSAMAEAAAQFQGAGPAGAAARQPRTTATGSSNFECLGRGVARSKARRRRKRAMLPARARGLWEQLGSPSNFLQVPFGHSRYHMFRGELIWRSAWTRIAASEPSTQ
jgi:hypothetical protein